MVIQKVATKMASLSDGDVMGLDAYHVLLDAGVCNCVCVTCTYSVAANSQRCLVLEQMVWVKQGPC